jgi:hypothetical protein
MAQRPDQSAGPRRHRRTLVVILGVAIVGTTLLALTFVPVGSASQVLHVAPGASAAVSISIPHPGWVTVHFDHPNGMAAAMHYWMQGSSGMMYDHSMMGGADSYSFWSWGGTYECGASLSGTGSGMMPVWVNSTWGML